ncbi:uncharacterized protein LOC129577963 [Sitodiplosis mosellana]|uniref:uncharacterized protein LOC129577963 n=1 Tax=Sitodiplosis mosellana TaxID=263140 RepID=UPI002443E495|nr:uncharacterized protein LOC129577963 [Sitodiplosis mosellana]XP_055321864.1 uncharacterized protein LOC129577963 [Sitodiplosis mosellana]
MLVQWITYIRVLVQRQRIHFHSSKMSSMANGTSKEKLAFCKCKRSACVRNYCQCYDQKRVCGPACRCFNCQNRFSTSTTNEEMAKSNNSKYNSSQMDQSSSSNGRGNRKLFENDAYESFAQSLFSTAKSCHQAGSSTQATQRKLLETFHAGLSRLNQDIDKKLNQK